ncbi:hypothetical protein COT69_00260 [candidate division WWE3 bacterium CG09_land_8_20_14_0_10_39_24]|uniref:Uncharacterized protein n=1 Tax=candidate division WWE3 bacterium CG09_land_8_20_14_0_10_39_24 TaxID=1975088 RepID=A0A2H0WKG0_UNCKA|nr:MAG: hypothetical protein AUJ94_01970 [bacterium CG2_30_40_12]OJI09647.1 MAG: hypothetical protein BK003_00255 [bacterium CG09_39_24]PIS13140.1 MAG: hypothetical protein COT69_00260 [candidate division WWE3 bacterium CG09_land_8_20_14_0_10_39_24]
MEKNNLLNLIDATQESLTYAIPVFAILFFLPVTSNFFEFNKIIFALAASSLALLIWAVKAVNTQKLILVKSPLDIGFGLLIISSILSTIFSISKFSSLFGQYGTFFPNIFIAVLLFSLYYALTSNIKSEKVIKNTVKSFVIAASLAALIGLLSYFNLTEKLLPFEWAQGGGFNTLGSPFTLGIISGIAFGISLSLITKSAEEKNTLEVALYTLTALITGFFILAANNIPTWVAAGVASSFVALNIYFNHSDKISKSTLAKTAGLSLAATLGLFAAITYIPSLTSGLGINYTRTTEITLDYKTSWQIATSALRDYPFFGSGVATYTTDFTIYKPLSFNSSPFWNLRFGKPSGEFFRIFSEQGLLGLGALIILVLAVIKFSLQSVKAKNDFMTIGLSAASFGLLAGMVFYSANTTLAFITVIILALLVSYQKDVREASVEEVVFSVSAISERLSLHLGAAKKEILTYVFMGIALLITIPTLFISVKGYAAEIYRKSALVSASQGNIGDAYNIYNKAILNNPFYDTYRRDAANIDIALIALIAQKGDKITEQDKSDMQQLVNQAVREVRLTTEKINPLSAANWEHRAWVFNQLTALDKTAAQASMDAAQRAIQLDPLNPILRVGTGNVVGVGSIYYSAGDFQRAAVSFAEAIQLKSDFANAYYNLSLSQAQLKNWEASATNMEIVLRLLPRDSEDFKIASENLKILQEQAEKAREELAKQQAAQEAQQEQIKKEPTPPQQPVVNETPAENAPIQTEPVTQPAQQ